MSYRFCESYLPMVDLWGFVRCGVFFWFITRYLRYLMNIWWVYFMGFLFMFADMLRFFDDCINCS